MKDEAKLLCRFPQEIKRFLERQADKYGSSMNSEVVRCIRAQMEKLEGSATAGK